MPENLTIPFFSRLWMAFVCFFRVIFKPAFATSVQPLLQVQPTPPTADRVTAEPPVQRPEDVHASGLFLLSMLQREGRFLDFLEEKVASFPDADVGAAARLVHEGCCKVVRQYLTLKPVVSEPEGSQLTLPAGFDAQRIRLTGNVAGQPPFKGSVKHHGWMTTEVKLPAVPTSLDLKVLAPAEVEL